MCVCAVSPTNINAILYITDRRLKNLPPPPKKNSGYKGPRTYCPNGHRKYSLLTRKMISAYTFYRANTKTFKNWKKKLPLFSAYADAYHEKKTVTAYIS